MVVAMPSGCRMKLLENQNLWLCRTKLLENQNPWLCRTKLLNPSLLNPKPQLKAKMKNRARSIATSTAWGTSK